MLSIGQTALISIISHFIFIYIAWRLVMNTNIAVLIKKGHEKEAQFFAIFIAILIGTAVSHFFLDIVRWTGELIYLF